MDHRITKKALHARNQESGTDVLPTARKVDEGSNAPDPVGIGLLSRRERAFIPFSEIRSRFYLTSKFVERASPFLWEERRQTKEIERLKKLLQGTSRWALDKFPSTIDKIQLRIDNLEIERKFFIAKVIEKDLYFFFK